ncbi:O-antigen chain length determining protein Wzz [Lonepinella sp. MS14437]
MNDLTKGNHQIDSIELSNVLWKKMLWIVVSTRAFTVIAGIYMFTAKEQWTSKAEVILPKVSSLGEYSFVV